MTLAFFKSNRSSRSNYTTRLIILISILAAASLYQISNAFLGSKRYLYPRAVIWDSNLYIDERLSRLNSFIYKDHTDDKLKPTSCFDLVFKHRAGLISETSKSSQEYPIDKSHVARTKTQFPFLISVHEKSIDNMRYSVFTGGEYYEKTMTKVIAEILDTETQKNTLPVMLDVGANIGWFSLLAASHGAEVFAFEPNVINMLRFCESQILNGWSLLGHPEGHNQIHSYMKGIGRDHGQRLKMYKPFQNPGTYTFNKEFAETSLAKQNKKGEEPKELDGEESLIVTLDAFAKDQGWLSGKTDIEIALMKMDVEGLEHLALQGAQELLRKKIIKNVILELNANSPRIDLITVVSILLSSGYHLYKIGNVLGPTDVVSKQYDDPKALIDDINTNKNINAWFKIIGNNGNGED